MVQGDFTAVVAFVGVSVQLAGELLLLILFVLLRRFVLRRAYFTTWTLAWFCGGFAIAAIGVRYAIMPALAREPIDESSAAVRLLYFLYQAGKLSSFAFFVSGTATYVTGMRVLGRRLPAFAAAFAYAGLSLLASPARLALNQLVVWQAPVAVVTLGACAALLFSLPASRRTLGTRASATAFMLLSALWLLYGIAFGLVGAPGGDPQWVSVMVNFNSYFDLLLNVALGFAMVVVLMEDAKREVDDAQAELRVAHDKLRRAALFDPLTDSLNRRAFEQGVGLEMARGTFGVVVIADLDNLKAVNDAFGHAAGDRLLRQCADLLRSTLRPYDKLYRWGGDEFLLILPSARAADIEARLAEVLSRAEPLAVPGAVTEVKLEVSLGASDYSSAETLDECIQLADQAMYRQKHSRKPPDRWVRAIESATSRPAGAAAQKP